ncbi:MAG: hypothetical protein ISS92_02570 [Candidatus Omnitrophica bacterium]|nr:hypothetical protein [Candidatus Omnitrophota bacterium]
MLAKILGTLWIAFGLFWLIKPASLKMRLEKKIGRKIKLIVYIFILVFGILILASVIRAPGWLPKLVGLLGIAITIYAIRLLTTRTSEKILLWLGSKPLPFFRILALAITGIGIMLMLA